MDNVEDKRINVRYDFDFTILNNNEGVDAIVTRSEFRGEGGVIQSPTRVDQLKIEARDHSIGMRPVPPAKTFRQLPEDEQKHVVDVVRAFWKAIIGVKELRCWVKL